MGIGLIFALFASVPEKYASDAAPYTVAQSAHNSDVVTYTITGPKQESTRAAAFALLGVPWLIGAFVSPFLHVPPSKNAPANPPSPIVISLILLVLGGLMCRQAWIRLRAANRKYQIAINTQTQVGTFTTASSDEQLDQQSPLIMICKTPDEKFHTISIVSREQSILLGMLRRRESAVIYAELLKEETGLHIGDSTQFRREQVHYHTSLTKLDDKALEKPIKTKPI